MRGAYIGAIAKLRDALHELRRITGAECPPAVYAARAQILMAQHTLEDQLRLADQRLADLERRQRTEFQEAVKRGEHSAGVRRARREGG